VLDLLQQKLEEDIGEMRTDARSVSVSERGGGVPGLHRNRRVMLAGARSSDEQSHSLAALRERERESGERGGAWGFIGGRSLKEGVGFWRREAIERTGRSRARAGLLPKDEGDADRRGRPVNRREEEAAYPFGMGRS
jgi:hypothetical protein